MYNQPTSNASEINHSIKYDVELLFCIYNEILIISYFYFICFTSDKGPHLSKIYHLFLTIKEINFTHNYMYIKIKRFIYNYNKKLKEKNLAISIKNVINSTILII